ncbi:MAG TPA: permease-like cell division protein FtsX [Candidatus Methylomirabilis sp.]|nr:permease-like cell division protein FtsX [Candidatus Methylomirabilis sp.]
MGFIVREAVRDLRRVGRVGVSAVLLITLSLGALGGFWLLSLNLGRAIGQWRDRIRLVAYLKEEPPAAGRDDVLRRMETIAGVQAVHYVSKDQALRSLKQVLGKQADVTEQLPANPLPASVEVIPDAATTTPEGTRALAQRLAEVPEVDEVQGGVQWVDRLAHFQRLFQLVALGVGAVLALAAVLTVTTATTLVLHLRRDELEIMRLVGAAESTIRLPLMLQGTVQGLLAAALALAALQAVYMVTVPRIEPLLSLTLGLDRTIFFSIPQVLLLVTAGALLGGLGGWLAGGRARS